MPILATVIIWLGLEQRNLTGWWHRLVGVSQAEVEEADTDKLRIAQLIVGALQIEVSIALHGLSGVTIVAVRAPQYLMCRHAHYWVQSDVTGALAGAAVSRRRPPRAPPRENAAFRNRTAQGSARAPAALCLSRWRV